MNEKQLSDRLHASADDIDQSPVPLSDIYTSGQAIARRRTGVRLAIGIAATMVAVAGVALNAPASVPAGSDLTTTDTASPGPHESRCPGDLVEPTDGTGPQCGVARDDEPWPGPGGLKQALEIELLSASPAQRRAFGDNRVTRVEHRAGFENFRDCLADQGFELSSQSSTRLGIDYSVPSEAVDSGADESCYLQHYKALDMAWQIPRADQVLYEDVLNAVNRCLTRNGVEPGADVIEATQRMRDAGLSEDQCELSFLNRDAPIN